MPPPKFNGWFLSKLTILIFSFIQAMLYPIGKINIDWKTNTLVPIPFAIAVFVWLVISRQRGNLDSDEPYSWDKPWFPMSLFPLHFWVFCSFSSWAAAGGYCSRFLIFSDAKSLTMAGCLFGFGSGFFVATGIFLLVFRIRKAQ